MTYHLTAEIAYQVTHTDLPADGGYVWPSAAIPSGWDGCDSWTVINVSAGGRVVLWGRYIYRQKAEDK